MRITMQSMSRNLANNIQQNLENLQRLQQENATGKRVQKLSDDPIAATRALTLRNNLRDIKQYNANIEDATFWLNLNESLMTQARGLTTTAKSAAQQALNGTTDASTRKSIATQIQGLREQMLSIANTKEKGRYVYSGFSTNTQPFGTDGVYKGDSGSIRRVVGPGGLSIAVNFSGQQVFQGGEDVFQVLQDLSDGLIADDSAKISAQLDKLSSLQDQFLEARTEVGTRINALKRAQTQLNDAEDFYKDSLSDAEDVDTVQAAIDLATAKNVYESSLAVTAGVVQKSLLDFLK